MKILQTGSGAPLGRSRKAGKADGASAGDSFKQQIQIGEAAEANAPAGTAALTALDGLLAVQEAPDTTSGKRRAILHGDTLLDELKELQIGLVQGWISEDRLRSLTHMLDQPRPAIDDPELSKVLDDIELRAAVELAKVERDRS